MALESITDKKARSFLTMLGILIGVGAVLILVTVVTGMNADMEAYYEKLGVNKVYVTVTQYDRTNTLDITDDLMGYPGTISLGVQGLVDVMSAITGQLYDYGARRFVFVNGHGGNVKSLSTVCMDLNRRGCLAALVNWWKVAPQLNAEWGGGHGDGMETSANLAIDPDAVDLSAYAPEGLRNDLGLAEGDEASEVAGGPFRTTGWSTVEFEGVSVDFPRRLDRFSSNGWLGYGLGVPPETASAERGRAMLEGTADYLVRFVRALEATALPGPLDDARELRRADAHIERLRQGAQR